MVKYFFLAFYILMISIVSARAQSPWYFGTGEAVNLTNGTAYKNGVKTIAGSLNPSSTAVSAPAGSMYYSTSGTIYVKQDAGLSTNWLPLGIATTGSLTTINGQSGPNVSIASGTSGSDFAVSAASNTVTLNLPTASAIARGALSSSDWSLFNSKEPAVTATTSADYYRGDKTFQPLNKAAVGLSNVDNTSDASKPISTATQAALNLKEDSIAAGTTSQYWRGDKSWQTLDKSAVGLSNVDNTSDANKPVSTATQTALNLKQDAATAATDSELTAGLATKEPTITTLPLSKGGTNKNMTAVNGGVVYTDSDSQEVSAAGTSGQILKSNGAAAPTWVNKSISGKAENLTAVTAETIVVPNNQLSNVGNNNEQLIETGNKNLLRNAGFEAFDGPFWTSTGSIVIGNNPLFGKAEAVVSVAATDLSLYQDSTLNAAQFADGVQGLASVWVKTSITSTPIYVCPRKAGVTTVSTSACVTVQANGKWGLYKIPFILGGTSNGIDVTSNSVSISSGSVSVDEAFVGAIDIKTDYPRIDTQGWVGGSTGALNLTLGGTATGTSTALFTVQSGTITALQKISVDADLYSAFTSSSAGHFVASIVGGNQDETISSATGQVLTATASASVILNAGDTLAFSGAATGTLGSFKYSIKAQSVVNSSSYSSSCGANCVDHLSAKTSSSGVVTDENVDWINGNPTLASSNQFTYTFKPGVFTTAPNCGCSMGPFGATAADYTCSVNSVSATTLVINTNANTTASFQTHQVFCDKTGADFTATRTIQGSFSEVMTTPGITKPKTCYYGFGGAAATLASPVECSTGTCVETYDSCGSGTPPSFSAAGIYLGLTFAPGTFANSTPVKCSVSSFSTTTGGARQGDLYFTTGQQTWTSSSTGGYVTNVLTFNSTALANSYSMVECEGQAP